ncbi:MAG: winged helix-turn-helix transcriptional regulator [Alphaproteobacteria bacterium]|nr:winged helix-turn-helix transcriptional regulator [Alphaproteobacteria bacterium]
MKITDLSPLQLQVFESFKSGESLTRMELKERLNITVRSTLARIISRLEVFGLLEKTEEVPERIQLTPQGERLIQKKQKESETLDAYDYITTEEIRQIADSYNDIPDPQLTDEDCEPISGIISVRDDIEWLRQLSLDVAGRVKGETDLNRISVWSRAASDLANTYSMLSFNELKELISD